MSLVLVTGATGFIGSHLCPFLLKQGYHVRGTFRQEPTDNLAPEIEWIKIGDIGPGTDWSRALDGVRYVIHLAALAHQIGLRGHGQRDEFMRVNADGTRRLAESISAAPTVARLVVVSSIGAVKSFSSEVLTAATPCEPDTDYGFSKRAAELAVEEVLQKTRADWCIIRPTLVYGPGNPGNMARLLKLIKRGVPLPFAAIANQRSFTFVGNLLDVIERCLSHPGASRSIFMVSDGEDLSTPELMRRLARYADKSLLMFPMPKTFLSGLGKVGDLLSSLVKRPIGLDSYSIDRLVGSLSVDISSLRQAIGWQAPFTVDEGLAQTLRPNGMH